MTRHAAEKQCGKLHTSVGATIYSLQLCNRQEQETLLQERAINTVPLPNPGCGQNPRLSREVSTRVAGLHRPEPQHAV